MSGRFERLLVVVLALVICAASVERASAQPTDTVTAVDRLFRQPVVPDWFAPSFLAQVPADKVAAIIKQLVDQYGGLREVTGLGSQLRVKLQRAEVPTFAALDEEGRFTGLFFQTPIPTVGTIGDAVAAIAALPGKTSVLVVSNGQVRAAHEPDAVLAIGSAFKLAVLAALDQAVADQRLAFEKVVDLDPGWRTLPSSTLINWPAATPLTIATLANFMISISDNMATDGLISLVGREAVEAVTPRNAPFPNTAEMFKLQANPAKLRAWLAADATGRRALLPALDALPLPRIDDLAKRPTGAEWFLSARELCALLDRVADSPALTINPGLADRADWRSVAFKGGSDAGVLNLSTRLVAADGTVHCVVATWNSDSPVAEETLAPLYRGLLKQLR